VYNVATISNLGAIIGSSLSTGTGTINGGAITGSSLSTGTGTINGGAITGSSISGTSGLISTTGSLQSRGLTIKNTFNNNVATITNTGGIDAYSCSLYDLSIIGAFSGTTLLSIGKITALTDLMNLQGTLNCYTFNIVDYNVSPTIVKASITTAGNASFLNTTITGGDLTVKDITNTTTKASINSLGFVTCAGVVSNWYNTKNATDNVGLLSDNTGGIINFANDAARTTAINIGNSATNIVFGGGTILGTTLSFPIISASNRVNTILVQPTGAGTGFDLCSTQTGTLNIGTAIGRTGNINIGTGQTTGTGNILIGSSILTGTGTQTLTINRPIRMPGLVQTAGLEIGYTQTDSAIFSTFTGNPTLSGTIMKTTITTTNLILNANYLIKYSLSISPVEDFNVTKFSYGLCTTGFIPGNSNNIAVLSGTTSTRFSTTDTYSYSGSGFFRYNNPVVSYGFGYLIDYLATPPIIATNIDLIRIS